MRCSATPTHSAHQDSMGFGIPHAPTFSSSLKGKPRCPNELSLLILDIKAVDMYFTNEPSIESMRLSAMDWELLESIECVLEVCSLNAFMSH